MATDLKIQDFRNPNNVSKNDNDVSEEGEPNADLPPMMSEEGQPNADLPPMMSEEGQPNADVPPMMSEESEPKTDLPPMINEAPVDSPKTNKGMFSGVMAKMNWLLKIVNFVLFLPIFIIFIALGFSIYNYLSDSIKYPQIGNYSNWFGSMFPNIKTDINVFVKKTSNDAIATNTKDSGVNILEKKIGKDKKQNKTYPHPDEVGSISQHTRKGVKSGYCYIGEDRGFRSCARVGNADKCMSGNIFPTEAICINPNLRE